jgi:hypothetical protein
VQKTRFLLYRFLLLVPLIIFLFWGIASCGGKVAAFTPSTVLSIVGGNVLIQRPGSSSWSAGKEGTLLETGYKIKTDTGATATVTLFDGSTISLNGDTEISLAVLINKSATTPKTIKIGQTIGETSSNIIKLIDPASRYEIDTPSGVAAVRGSKMVVQVVTDGITSVYNVEGTISFTAQGQEVMIPVGSVSSAKPGETPSAPQPGTPPAIGVPNVTSVSSLQGWQQTGLYLKSGDKYYVEYRGGSWSVDTHGYGYIGPTGISPEDDKEVAPSSKFVLAVPYGCLIGKVGSGNAILIGDKGGPFNADATGFLSLRMNDGDETLGDNDGAISVALRASVYSAFDEFSSVNNPDIAWSYGWMPTDFSKFNLYVTHSTIQWYGPQGGDRSPSIWINNGDTAYGVPTGWLSLHPGPGTEPSILRWTAPVAGNIHVTGQFLPGDGGIMTVGVFHNAEKLWTASDSGKFDLNIIIAGGDNIDFAVYGGYGFGNTPISATISYGD